MRRTGGLIGTLVIVLLSLSPAVKANDDDDVGFRFQYAAKFSCGSVPVGMTAPVIQGQYATAVAIHNPHRKDVTLRKKIALVFPPGGQNPGPISAFITEKLTPDQALEVTCQEIPSTFSFTGTVTFGSFVQGFLVVETTRSVDVTATYSAGPSVGGGPSAPTLAASTTLTVATVDVERVHERKISREEDDDKDKEKDKDKDKEGDKEGKR
jgi:hypothetical protein